MVGTNSLEYHVCSADLGCNYSDKTLRELGELAGGMQYPAVTMAVRRFTDPVEDRCDVSEKDQTPPSNVAC
jgi:hypothetical protein